MKSITINGSQRESVGKKATKALRNAGQVPCVVYGGDKQVHFAAAELAFTKLVYTASAHTAVIALDNGESINAILKDIQFHPVTDKILHVDFYQIFDNKEVTLTIPVHFEGTALGVLDGGILRKTNRKLRIKAIPSKLPDFIVADTSALKIGNKLYVTDMANEDYSILHPDNTVVASVRMSRAAIKTDDEAEEATEEGAEEATPAAE